MGFFMSVTMDDQRFESLTNDVGSVKVELAQLGQRMEGIDKAVISIADSQKQIVEIVANQHAQVQVNKSFEHRHVQAEKRLDRVEDTSVQNGKQIAKWTVILTVAIAFAGQYIPELKALL
jgi:hypothetical protein